MDKYFLEGFVKEAFDTGMDPDATVELLSTFSRFKLAEDPDFREGYNEVLKKDAQYSNTNIPWPVAKTQPVKPVKPAPAAAAPIANPVEPPALTAPAGTGAVAAAPAKPPAPAGAPIPAAPAPAAPAGVFKPGISQKERDIFMARLNDPKRLGGARTIEIDPKTGRPLIVNRVGGGTDPKQLKKGLTSNNSLAQFIRATIGARTSDTGDSYNPALEITPEVIENIQNRGWWGRRNWAGYSSQQLEAADIASKLKVPAVYSLVGGDIGKVVELRNTGKDLEADALVNNIEAKLRQRPEFENTVYLNETLNAMTGGRYAIDRPAPIGSGREGVGNVATLGAVMGSPFGPLGAGVGAGVGATVGAIPHLLSKIEGQGTYAPRANTGASNRQAVDFAKYYMPSDTYQPPTNVAELTNTLGRNQAYDQDAKRKAMITALQNAQFARPYQGQNARGLGGGVNTQYLADMTRLLKEMIAKQQAATPSV